MKLIPLEKTKIFITLLVIISSSFLIFYNLGHYGLWDDEATCALYAQSLWKTGDTYALLGHNLIAYNGGVELKNLHMRYIPPLQFYIAAPWASFNPGSSFVMRFPFAVLGFLTIIFILFWLWKSRASIALWLLIGLGLLGNASLFLYFRQCRYYSPSIFFTLVLSYLYWNRKDNKAHVILFLLTSLLLLLTNYLSFAAAIMCILADYAIWGFRRKPLKYSTLAIIAFVLIVFGLITLKSYNPLGIDPWGMKSENIFLHKITLFFWNLRDMNSCEMGVGVLLLLSPFLYLKSHDVKFIRGTFAVVFYCFIIAIFSAQPEGLLNVANVRYLAPVIPLCIYVSSITIEYITKGKKTLVLIIGILAFWTNLLNGGPFVGVDQTTSFTVSLPGRQLKSSIINLINELVDPNPNTIRITAEWINQNVKYGESIWVIPSYMNYPLMFHAPKAIYAWQLTEKEGQFKNLPDIHFWDVNAPDYIINFGPSINFVKFKIKDFRNKNIHYNEIKMIDLYWYDLIRPELFWHSFKIINNYSKEFQTIRIFKKEPLLE